MAVFSLIRLESLSFDCVKNLEIVDMRFNLFVPLCDCRSAAPIPKLEASHIAKIVDLDLELCLRIVL